MRLLTPPLAPAPLCSQKPIELGCDLVIQSTTKFYDGHNMTVGGAVIAATPELHERIKHMQNVHGNIMSPQNAFYTLQTCKTLGLRIERQVPGLWNAGRPGPSQGSGPGM